MEQYKRRRLYIGTPAQKKLLNLIFASAIIPAGIAIISLYYIIFNLLTQQMMVPETIVHNLIPVLRMVNLIILITIPITLLIIWSIALVLSNRILGPLYRLEKELDARIAGQARGPIKVREKDVLKPLADKINKLLSK